MQKVFWIETAKELNDLNKFLELSNGKVVNIVATSYGVRGYDGGNDLNGGHNCLEEISAFVVVDFEDYFED